MPFVSMRDLQRQTAKVVDEATESGKPVVVTRNGKPVAILTAVDEQTFEDFLLARLPNLAADTREALESADAGSAREAKEIFADMRAAR